MIPRVKYFGSFTTRDTGTYRNTVTESLLIGIEMKQNCQALVALALEKGLLINVTAERVIRLLPPLTIDSKQTIELAKLLVPCINAFTHTT